MNRNVRKRTFGDVLPAQILISLRICAFCIAKDKKFLHTSNKDYNQTARMRRLIWDFVGLKCLEVRFPKLRFI